MRREMEVLGIGLLGAGFINEFHLKAFRYVRGAEITAICSRRHGSAGAWRSSRGILGSAAPGYTPT